VARGLVGAALLGGVGFSGLVAWVWRVSREDQRRPVDAIVVLGAAHYNGRPSPVLKARVDHALELYQSRLAPTMVLTGGTHPGDTESEARVQRRYLAAAGVPDSVLVELPQGQSTEASMNALSEWARESGVHSVLLVSDGFHLGRLRLEASRIALTAYTTPAPKSPIGPGTVREMGYLVREAAKLPVIWIKSIR
jgi:uncharacterized SAM-binding protein YcdF (DUF218 family)